MTESAVSGTPYMLWVVGILLAGAVLAYAAVRRRGAKAPMSTSDDATERLYAAEDRDPANK
ncbi:cytochrome c-type biogenesis protein CcmH/NrfF [Methylopila capsulata]|uniref:Cytochrome c-type biogenesis protein CcmH/NrfF n=1 Tax=Methylopila capsulata TaxID=61654 RepID=A0A9W6MQ80_9HYPH|nr:hypothetical protein [Methylopila capsulata]MBM7850925.1 cytochrome c-type biogenesis protein CcmH/NrfF [Methylopila capsulata]GLK53983.1 hypothetical protein GCM10008170_00020 [Methylopila capsulata]